MKEIKTRDTAKDIRVLDRTANVADKIKNAYIRTKERADQTQQTNTDSPVGYAEDCAAESAQDVTHKVGHELRNQGKRLTEKTQQKLRERHTQEDAPEPGQPEAKGESSKVQQKATTSKASASSHKPHVSDSNLPDYTTHGRIFMRDSARRRTERIGTEYAGKETRRSVKTAERGVKQSARASEKTIKPSVKGSVKTVKHGIKIAQQSSHATIKTSQAAAKTAAKTAKATAKAAQRAAQTARLTAKATVAAAKTVAKAVVATVKALIAAAKGIIAAIAAGGWVAVVVIVVILLAAYILGSVFGLFASEDGYNGAPSMPEVASQTNAEFSAKLDAIIQANPHDRLVINNVGSAFMVANWNEVLAIYAVIVSTDPDNPTQIATLDDAKIAKLKTVFWDMNHISYSLDEVEVGIDEDTGELITETVLTITVSYEAAEDMILYYGFSSERATQVRELLQPEYAELFLRLTGSYVDITLSAAEISAIMATLPDDLSKTRKEVVLAAYSLLDKVNYFWGGKSLMLGWDSRWGTPMKVTADDSSTTGTVRSFGLDCSGFVDWVFYNAYGGEYIIGHGGGAIAQYSYCSAINWSEAQPGDLAFYPDCEHVGVVVMNDDETLTIIHCASGHNNVVITQHAEDTGFAFVGRPQIYGD